MITKVSEYPRFSKCLVRAPANSTDAHQRRRPGRIGAVHLFSGQLQDWAVQADVRISNRKLCGMYTNRETTGAGGNIVARKCPLAALIQAPLACESQWMSGNYQSLTECRADP